LFILKAIVLIARGVVFGPSQNVVVRKDILVGAVETVSGVITHGSDLGLEINHLLPLLLVTTVLSVRHLKEVIGQGTTRLLSKQQFLPAPPLRL
jgi:hypothetical protein